MAHGKVSHESGQLWTRHSTASVSNTGLDINKILHANEEEKHELRRQLQAREETRMGFVEYVYHLRAFPVSPDLTGDSARERLRTLYCFVAPAKRRQPMNASSIHQSAPAVYSTSQLTRLRRMGQLLPLQLTSLCFQSELLSKACLLNRTGDDMVIK